MAPAERPSIDCAMPGADDGGPGRPTSTTLADALRALADRLDEQAYVSVPGDEPALASGGGLRRRIKLLEFRLLRPFVRRSDRTAAQLATLTAELADAVTRLDDAVRRVDVSAALAARSTEPPVGPRRDEPSIVSDSFYWRFEAEMRGSPDLIEARLRQYERFAVPWREEAGRGPALWIDLGAGKGEFGSVLRGWGWDVLGVETSPEAFEASRAAGIDAVLADARSFLEAYEGRAPSAVSAIQVIEHLPPPDWLPLIHAVHRVLEPGGHLLLETINPLNVNALSQHFFADVTHTWPMHPEVARLMAEDAGFDRAEIVFLNADHRGNAEDFALVATKAPGATDAATPDEPAP
jgi:SAM-dependent methyltransferase